MSGWDVLRAKKRGVHGRTIPRCRKCNRISVLDPCRDCASPAQLAKYPDLPDEATR